MAFLLCSSLLEHTVIPDVFSDEVLSYSMYFTCSNANNMKSNHHPIFSVVIQLYIVQQYMQCGIESV